MNYWLEQTAVELGQFIVVCGSLALVFPPYLECMVERFVPFTGSIPFAGSFIDSLRCVCQAGAVVAPVSNGAVRVLNTGLPILPMCSRLHAQHRCLYKLPTRPHTRYWVGHLC